VFHATGAFVSEIPVTPERLQAAIERSAEKSCE
jgi:CO/xanthine dehydrogenase Mo-binding subunit